MITDLDGNITDACENAGDFFIFEKPEDVLGHNIGSLYVNLDDRRQILQILGDKGVLNGYTVMARAVDVATFPVCADAVVLMDESGRPTGRQTIITKISP